MFDSNNKKTTPLLVFMPVRQFWTSILMLVPKGGKSFFLIQTLPSNITMNSDSCMSF